MNSTMILMKFCVLFIFISFTCIHAHQIPHHHHDDHNHNHVGHVHDDFDLNESAKWNKTIEQLLSENVHRNNRNDLVQIVVQAFNGRFTSIECQSGNCSQVITV